MNNKKILALYGLKYNPFHSEVPVDGLFRTTQAESFLWRVEDLVMDGGIALVTGDPGVGKSTILRLLHDRLSGLREVTVAALSRPQSSLADFYRELGECFGVALRVSNRWGGYKALRDRWRHHIETTLMRPVLLVDEAQEMNPVVLSEIRLLAADQFDSRKILTIILSGDKRLEDKLGHVDLLPLSSRIRTRLSIEPFATGELAKLLEHTVATAGNKQLLTAGLRDTLTEHALGNPRAMMNMADEVLAMAVAEEKPQLDEKTFFELMEGRLARRRVKRGKNAVTGH